MDLKLSTVSVIIPCFKCMGTIDRALNSIKEQAFKPLEVILIEDCSADGTLEYLTETKKKYSDFFEITVLALEKNVGAGGARNFGLQQAKGKYIAFLDADDFWHPQKLQIIISTMEERNIKIMGHAHTLYENCNDTFLQKDLSNNLKSISFYFQALSNFAVTPSVVIRRDIIELFNEKMRYAEDHELFTRLAYKNGLFFLDIPLVTLGRTPLSPGGLSQHRWKMRKGELYMYFQFYTLSKKMIFVIPVFMMFSLLKHIRREALCLKDSLL